MGDLNILEELFDEKLLKILKLFLREKENQFYLREISKETGVPVATTYRIIENLQKLNIIRKNKIKKFKLYQLKDNEDTKFLAKFLREEKRILDLFVNKIKRMENVRQVILHGEEKKNRANVLLIGENIDSNKIKRICAEIKEKFDFVISALPLVEEQFSQISNMGLYSGKKKILFERE